MMVLNARADIRFKSMILSSAAQSIKIAPCQEVMRAGAGRRRIVIAQSGQRTGIKKVATSQRMTARGKPARKKSPNL